jgi:hypothetical protein
MDDLDLLSQKLQSLQSGSKFFQMNVHPLSKHLVFLLLHPQLLQAHPRP